MNNVIDTADRRKESRQLKTPLHIDQDMLEAMIGLVGVDVFAPDFKLVIRFTDEGTTPSYVRMEGGSYIVKVRIAKDDSAEKVNTALFALLNEVAKHQGDTLVANYSSQILAVSL